jgi:hypothetical protein
VVIFLRQATTGKKPVWTFHWYTKLLYTGFVRVGWKELNKYYTWLNLHETVATTFVSNQCHQGTWCDVARDKISDNTQHDFGSGEEDLVETQVLYSSLSRCSEGWLWVVTTVEMMCGRLHRSWRSARCGAVNHPKALHTCLAVGRCKGS